MKALLISPHLDDAVLSAGKWLAGNPGSTVATLYAGIPKDKDLLTEYDAKMGFVSSAEAMRKRRAEDVNAMKILEATPVHFNYLDNQYVADKATFMVALKELIRLTDEHDIIIGPLGIRHEDHIATRRVIEVLSTHVNMPIYLWADLPYRVTDPGSAWPLAKGLKKEMPSHTGSAEQKLKACEQYRSQWGKYDITPYTVIGVAEEMWRLA